jgi:hypothetical protein
VGARILIHGRVAWQSPGLRPRHTVRVDPVDAYGNPVGAASAPVYKPSLPERPGVPWTDEDGTVYRVVTKLDAAEGWVGAETVMGWYGVGYDDVARWVREGVLDGAMEAGSPSKRFRVRDPHRLYDALTVAREREAARKGRGRRKR